VVRVPEGPGLGVAYAAAFLRKAVKVEDRREP
jgi:hypothetical protein